VNDEGEADMTDTTQTDMIISVDDHVIEPAHLFEAWLPKKFQEAGVHPRVDRRRMGGMVYRGGTTYEIDWSGDGPECDVWLYEDLVFPLKRHIAAVGFDRNDMTLSPITYEEMRPGCYDPIHRLVDMDADGVQTSLCFPTFPRFCGQTFSEAHDKDLAFACVEAYNRWMLEEWCGQGQGRLVPLGIVPLWNAELAAQVVRYNASNGFAAVAFSEIPAKLGLPSIHTGYWDPFFKACEETDTIICMHIGSSSQMPSTSSDAPPAVAATLSFVNAMSSVSDFMFSGVFVRYPKLKIAYSEGQIGWVPYILERADDVWAQHRAWGGVAEITPEPPSRFWQSNVYGCFFRDPHGVDNLYKIGVDTVPFETDYPHTDSTWPYSRKIFDEQTSNLSQEDRIKVMRGNAIRMLRLTPEGLWAR
jgi:predicted TIM-barrel fold metal-dependent hydrolase